jgi:hypothetical protein
MKYGTIKTLGVTALGAAFAATGAGAASAAPAHGVDTPTDVAMSPLQDVAEQLPAGASEAFAAGGAALAAGTQTLPATLGATSPELMDTLHSENRQAPSADALKQRVQEQLAEHRKQESAAPRQDGAPRHEGMPAHATAPQQVTGLLGGLPLGGAQNPENGGNAGLLGALPIGG